VLRLLLNNFSPKALYHDLYLDMNRGHYSQLDIVLATRVGVVVFEVKEMSGWILGSGRIRGPRGGDSLASNRRPKR